MDIYIKTRKIEKREESQWYFDFRLTVTRGFLFWKRKEIYNISGIFDMFEEEIINKEMLPIFDEKVYNEALDGMMHKLAVQAMKTSFLKLISR